MKKFVIIVLKIEILFKFKKMEIFYVENVNGRKFMIKKLRIKYLKLLSLMNFKNN